MYHSLEMHFNCSFHYHSFLNGNAFQLFQVCHFYLINHNMIFRLKYGSCIQLFLIRRIHDAGTYVLKPRSYNRKCVHLF